MNRRKLVSAFLKRNLVMLTANSTERTRTIIVLKIRINTNGHANYVYKKNIVPELVGLIDESSVSLNGSTSEEYDELSQPKFEGAYDEVKKFIKCCSDAGIKTDTSIVDGYKGRRLDIKKCEAISKDLGAKLRVREWIVNGYS